MADLSWRGLTWMSRHGYRQTPGSEKRQPCSRMAVRPRCWTLNGARAGDSVSIICREACVEGHEEDCPLLGEERWAWHSQLRDPILLLLPVMLRAEPPRVSSQEEVVVLKILVLRTYVLCCTLLRSQLVWVTGRHLLQPSVRLISVKAPPVHFQTSQWHVWLVKLPSN